jgi:hypothetical protein
MPLVKSHNRLARKQATTLSHRGSVERKVAAGKKTSSSANSPKSGARKSRPSAKFSSLKSRQTALENAKRSVWASLHSITEALIRAANMGNLATAKELFNFAGVYSLPAPEDECAVATVATLAPASDITVPKTEPAMVHPIDLFFKRIGVEPSTAEAEPEAA